MTMRRTTALVFTAAALVACGGSGSTNPPPGNGGGNGNGGPPGQGPPLSGSVTISIDDIAFIDPDGGRNTGFSLRVEQGTDVTFRNDDAVVHTVTSGEGQGGVSGDGLPAGASAGMDSGPIDPGTTFEFTFDALGTWTFYCEFHPGIMYDATVEVVAP